MPISDDEERELKVSIMRADLANKNADTDYKRGLLRYEPWKVVLGGMTAGAAMFAAGAAFMKLFGH